MVPFLKPESPGGGERAVGCELGLVVGGWAVLLLERKGAAGVQGQLAPRPPQPQRQITALVAVIACSGRVQKLSRW